MAWRLIAAPFGKPPRNMVTRLQPCTPESVYRSETREKQNGCVSVRSLVGLVLYNGGEDNSYETACSKDTRTPHRTFKARVIHTSSKPNARYPTCRWLAGRQCLNMRNLWCNDIQLATSWPIKENTDLAAGIIEHHYWPPLPAAYASSSICISLAHVCSTGVMSYPCAGFHLFMITMQALDETMLQRAHDR